MIEITRVLVSPKKRGESYSMLLRPEDISKIEPIVHEADDRIHTRIIYLDRVNGGASVIYALDTYDQLKPYLIP